MNIDTSLDWEAVRVFLSVARRGSMLAAARALGSSQPSVTRVIQRLEASAKQRLFVRHARGVRLTALGEALQLHAEAAEVSLASFNRVVRAAPQVAGCLRIATTEFLGVEVLAPRLHEFRESFPGIRLELVLQNSASSLTSGEADIAVRLFRPREVALVTRRVASLQVGFFASDAYLRRRGEPQSMDELLQHDLVGYDPRGALASSVLQLDPRLTADAFALGTDCLSAHVALARGGFGIAGLQVGFARRYSELRPVLREFQLPEAEVWLVTHEDLRTSGPVSAGLEWLNAVLTEYAEESRG